MPRAYPRIVQSEPSLAAQFIELFSAIFAALHRRGEPSGPNLTPEGRGLLVHLAWSGPLTVGELAQHTGRAQSVISESVSVLESHEMLARVRDPRDRRKTLVWLTDRARDWLAQEHEPLDRARTEAALGAVDPQLRQQLIDCMTQFVAQAKTLGDHRHSHIAPTAPHEQKKHKKAR
jgi:DNA-binding MarR family transcriptional regulator